MLSRTAESGIAAEFRSVRGDPLAELTRIAEQAHADAVVVGASEHLGHRIVGSLLAARAWCGPGNGRSPSSRRVGEEVSDV